ncbi:MAG: fibronectin type III domain-containing protein [Candidatus Sericytochromatia bacterium]|nr:fibronectin type III domain-containing protein [Candidatus Sericytochromatia bacterium]
MRKRDLLTSILAFSLLTACGDKQPPSTLTPGGGLDSGLGGLDGGGLTPLDPIGGGDGFEDPGFQDPGQFTPNDGFIDEPLPEEPLPEEPLPEEPLPEEPLPEEPLPEEPEPTPEPAPTEPSALASSNVTQTAFNVSWTGIPDAESYKIYLNNELKAQDLIPTSFSFTGLTPDTPYTVQVSAVTESGETAKSTALEVTTAAIGAPAGLAAAEVGYDTFKLTWEAVQGATSYTLYLGGEKKAEGLTGTSHTVTGLDDQTLYSVQLTAITPNGESAKSAVLEVTTEVMPDPFGNERLGFLNMTAMDTPNGLDVKNGYAYAGHYRVVDRTWPLPDRPERLLRTLNIATGTAEDKVVSQFNPDTTPIRIAGIAVNAALVWVALDGYDDDERNLYQFNISGQLLNRYQAPSNAPGTIIDDIAVDGASGHVYIASRTNNSIIKYNPVNPESSQLKFSGNINIDPLGLAVDDEGHVYTFDAIGRKVVKFSKEDGSRLLEFAPAGLNGTGENYTAVSDVAVDPRNGEIYVTGTVQQTVKIHRYSPEGNFIRSFTAPDLIAPRKMTVDADGKIYVVENNKGGILVFSAGLTPAS